MLEKVEKWKAILTRVIKIRIIRRRNSENRTKNALDRIVEELGYQSKTSGKTGRRNQWKC